MYFVFVYIYTYMSHFILSKVIIITLDVVLLTSVQLVAGMTLKQSMCL